MEKDTSEKLLTIAQIVWENRESWKAFFQLFDLLPNVYFHIKDASGRFLWMNAPLRNLLGIKGEGGFSGKTDADFFSPDLVFLYLREDNEVLSSGKPILNQPWIVPGRSEKTKWYISSKLPLFDDRRQVVGTTGIMRNLTHEFEAAHPLTEMREVVDFIFEHYHERISIEQLASLAFLSCRQFERRFRRFFFMSPSDFVLKIRIDVSVRLLIETDFSITKIANRVGFYDNSYYTRQFKKAMGLSPLQFRKKFLDNQYDNY